MKRRNIAILTISLILIAICGLVLLIGYYTFLSSGFMVSLPHGWFRSNNAWVESDDSKSLKIKDALDLEIHNDSGTVDIKAAEEGLVDIKIHKKAGAINQESAQKALDNIHISITQEKNKVMVDVNTGDNIYVIEPSIQVDLTVYVPPRSKIWVENSFGDVYLNGTQGDADFECSHGSLFISDVDGSITAKTSSGQIEVSNIETKSGIVELDSEFGDIDIQSLEVSSLTAGTSSGDVNMSDIDAVKEIRVESSYGSIDFDQGSSDYIYIHSQSGKLSIYDVHSKRSFDITTNYGDIRLSAGAAKKYHIVSNNGSIIADRLSGDVEAATDFGHVDFTDSFAATLKLESKNGDIDYAGNLGAGPHSITTDFGDIALILAEDISLDIDMRTDFGAFRTEFEFSQTGDVGKNRWQGKIGEGGTLLECKTNNGDIIMKRSTNKKFDTSGE